MVNSCALLTPFYVCNRNRGSKNSRQVRRPRPLRLLPHRPTRLHILPQQSPRARRPRVRTCSPRRPPTTTIPSPTGPSRATTSSASLRTRFSRTLRTSWQRHTPPLTTPLCQIRTQPGIVSVLFGHLFRIKIILYCLLSTSVTSWNSNTNFCGRAFADCPVVCQISPSWWTL